VLANIEIWRAIPDLPKAEAEAVSWQVNWRQQSGWQLLPRTWWYESCIQLYHAGQNAIERIDAATGRFLPTINWSDLDGLPLDGETAQLLQQHIWWGGNVSSVAFVQTSLNQAIIACALERFWLANGVYPATIAELVPALLERMPHDAVSGRPILYQRDGNGSYLLRGVGPNGKHDRENSASDDWLWAYSTNAPAANRSLRP
jgi:hypothetical protein